MKKALIALLALACLSALVYADGGSTVGMGFGRSQFDLAYSTGVSGSNIQQGYNYFGFPQVQRFSMDYAWSNDKTGVNIDAYLGQPSTALNFVNVYATAKLMPDMLWLRIGKWEGDGFDAYRVDTAHPIHDINNGNAGRFMGWGAMVDVAPKDSGFEATLFAKTSVADPFSYSTSVANSGAVTVGSTGSVDTDLANMIYNYEFAGSYTVPNLVKIAAGSTTDGVWPAPQRKIFANAWLLAVPNLNAFLSFRDSGFDLAGTPTNIEVLLGASYTMSPLQAIIGVDVANTSVGSVTTWQANPEVIYTMGAFSLGLYVSVNGSSASGAGIGYEVEPYVKLNDFGIRISFDYQGNTVAKQFSSGAADSIWAIPVLIDWGF